MRVGSKNFTEQVVLGEIIAQHLEHRLHQKVERRLNLGGTLLAHQALLAGEIDLYPEYSGTALVAVLKEPIQTDPAAVLGLVRAEYARRFHVAWLDSLGINNGFAMVVRGDNKNLKTLTDTAQDARPWVLGVGYEFEQRVDGLKALQKTYSLRPSQHQDHGPGPALPSARGRTSEYDRRERDRRPAFEAERQGTRRRQARFSTL